MSIVPAPTDPPEVEDYLWEGWSGHIGWDVGANCGQSIPKMVRLFKTIVAFEPASECKPFLDRVCRSHLSASWHPIALSNQDGD